MISDYLWCCVYAVLVLGLLALYARVAGYGWFGKGIGAKGEVPMKQNRAKGLTEVCAVGRTFRGVILPTGPEGQAMTVRMYVAVASTTESDNDTGVITPHCATLPELRAAVNHLKDDLECLYQSMARKDDTMRRAE